MEDVATVCDKILVLNKGSVSYFDTVRNVFSKSEELKALGLGVPQVTDVFSKIKTVFPDFSYYPLTVEEGIIAVKEYISKGGMSE